MIPFLDQWTIDYLVAYCSFMGCLCMFAIFINQKMKMSKAKRKIAELKEDIERCNRRNRLN
jgi:hypothetical protein